MSSEDLPLDQPAREVIASEHDRTLFVEAGAGCGKTEALVGRVINLVLSPIGISLENIAVITFTNKAAAELRHRIRIRFEELLAGNPEPSIKETILASLEQIDEATISTLHGFARHLLTEHSVEAELPPDFEVLDEMSTQVEFQERFEQFFDELLVDPMWTKTLLIGDALGINPARDLLPLAVELHKNWDLLELTDPPHLTEIRFEDLISKGRAIARREGAFVGNADSDSMTECLTQVTQFVRELESAFDEIQQVAALMDCKLPSGKRAGRKENWTDIDGLRGDYQSYRDEVILFRTSLTDLVLRRLTACLTNFILAGIGEQRKQGRLDYQDLLVSTKEILCDPTRGSVIRSKIADKYQCLLVDEFQDTDPIQIEIVTLIASAIDTESWTSWQAAPTLPGHLFFVGDPKQSIYRFRRADISLYLDTQKKYETGQLQLSTNFRSTPEIISWINKVFGDLINSREGSQPSYTPLTPMREPAPAGAAVSIVGSVAHPKSTIGVSDADSVRLAEAHDSTQHIFRIVQEGLSVQDNNDWRAARLSDIAILVPTRSRMTELQRDFDRAGVSYRVASSYNVWRSPEIRDLVIYLKAINDPSDSLATVSALRSSVYGCGDDDLYRFRTNNSDPWVWDPLANSQHATRTKASDPVALGLAHLAELHREKAVVSTSELVGKLVKDRQLEEQCAARRHPGESLRRLRYVVDQARAWSDTHNGDLQTFLSWITQQTAENARPIETIISEDDDDSVQIMTVHAAKGLEFPIAIVAGLPLRAPTDSGAKVGYPQNSLLPEVKIRKDVKTLNFDDWSDAEKLFDRDESIRTLYVACTRARDHLVISLHRKETTAKSGSQYRIPAELLLGASNGAPHTEFDYTAQNQILRISKRDHYASRPGISEWRERYANAVDFSSKFGILTATRIARASESSMMTSERDETFDPGLLKDAEESELPLQSRGRYGTAIGRAVHAVLQTVDLKDGNGVKALAKLHAAAEGIPELSEEIASLASSAIDTQEVQSAVQGRYWRELHVACPINGQLIEGYVDLVYESDDGLVVIDYKTDQIEPKEIESKVDRYRLQGATYALALEETTHEKVSKVVFAFLSSHATAKCVSLPNLQAAIVDAKEVIRREAEAGSRP